MKNSSVKRFTLIELLVVIAIIGILAGLVFPALGTVRNSAKKSKASSECQGLKAAIVMYESEFSCWPVNVSSDTVVTGSDYVEMCRVLTGKNGKKTVFFEVGVGYDENKGILDPWGRPYQVALDGDFDNVLKESSIPAIKEVNNVNGRGGQNLRSRVAVYSFGVNENEKDASNIPTLAKKKKLVTSW